MRKNYSCKVKSIRLKGSNKMEPINLQPLTERTILNKTDVYKAICFIFEEGKGLPNHIHPGLATIQVLDGSLDMKFADGTYHDLKTGDFLGFDASIEHNLIAKEKSKVLVTIMFK